MKMGRTNSIFLHFALFFLVYNFIESNAELTIVPRTPVLYDTVSPKLRIQGTGFEEGIKLTLAPPLKQGKDYDLQVVSETVLALTLTPGKRWAVVTEDMPQIKLFVTAVVLNNVNLLEESDPIPVASVIGTPTIVESSTEIYMTTTHVMSINGTGLSKVHALVFDPKLVMDEDYSIVVHNYDQITILLKTGKKWRKDPGPLMLARIDGGGGLLQLNTRGVMVAMVQADLAGHGVSIENSRERIYQSTPTLVISGSGFNPEGTKLRFTNGLIGAGANYTITAITDTSLTLKLNRGVQWKQNVWDLPGDLVVLAADAGDGWVALGATASKRGRAVATVYENPLIEPSDQTIYETHSHHLTVYGAGFVEGERPKLTTSPELQYGENYTITVLNRTCMVLELGIASKWCDAPCDLLLTSIDTGAGVVGLGKKGAGIPIATVVNDEAAHSSGISVVRSNDVFYQSAHYKPLVITGTGFTSKMTVIFYPPLPPENFKLKVDSAKQATFTLTQGQKWREDHGPLVLFSIDPDGAGKKEGVVLGSSLGIQVANILKDPVVKESNVQIFASHTTTLSITGSGFDGGFGVGEFPIALKLSPTEDDAYSVVSNSDKIISLKLNEGKKWAKVEPGKTVQLLLKAIDSGAGEEQYETPIKIATVIADLPDSLKGRCDDSCIYANDGTCDEGGRSNPVDDWGNFEGSSFGYDYYMPDFSDWEYFGYGYGGHPGLGYNTLAGISACEKGTDCTDCGGLSAQSGPSCENTCRFQRDGFCDDPRGTNLCDLGTDCQDCGPKEASNFTNHWDTAWFDSEDDFFFDYYEDLSWWDQPDPNPFQPEAITPAVNPPKNLKPAVAQEAVVANKDASDMASAPQVANIGVASSTLRGAESQEEGSAFIPVLEGVVALIGLGVLGGIGFVVLRKFRGQPISYLAVSQTETGVEMGGTTAGGRFRGPITPDVVRTGERID